MGKQTTAYMPGDQYERWQATAEVTGTGKPPPLSQIIELGLEAWYSGHMVPRPPDAVDVIARLIRDGLVEAGLLDG